VSGEGRHLPTGEGLAIKQGLPVTRHEPGSQKTREPDPPSALHARQNAGMTVLGKAEV